jgi:hypothetical protein
VISLLNCSTHGHFNVRPAFRALKTDENRCTRYLSIKYIETLSLPAKTNPNAAP